MTGKKGTKKPNMPKAVIEQTKKNTAKYRYKKGDKRAVENGRKGGKARLGYRDTSTILKQFSELDPEDIFIMSKEDKQIARVLAKMGAHTAKDLIMCNMIHRVKDGNMQAMKTYLEQLGEDKGQLIRLTGPDGKEPLTVDMLHRMSVEDLMKLETSLEDEINKNK